MKVLNQSPRMITINAGSEKVVLEPAGVIVELSPKVAECAYLKALVEAGDIRVVEAPKTTKSK